MTEDTAIVEMKPDYRLGIIPAKTPHDVLVQASIIAKELAKVVRDNKLASTIQGREFVRVEGWSTMGAMLGVLPREIPDAAQRFDDGSYKAAVELIRISDGAVIGRASAIVGMDEKDRNGKLTWGSRAEYARYSMALTRATGKAYRLGFSWIMGLAGFESTPAEEMDSVIDAEYHEAPPARPAGNGKHSTGRPLAPDTLAEFLNKKAAGYNSRQATDKQRNLFAGMMDAVFVGDDDKRHTVQLALFGAQSANDIPDELILAGLDWLKPVKDSGGAFQPDPMAVTEAQAVYTASLIGEGQQELI